MKKEILRDLAGLALLCLLCWAVSRWLFQLALVEGGSMEPSYHSGQPVIINKLDREFSGGDVVLFYNEHLNTTLIKRIAACPGDSVQIIDSRLCVNGDTAPGVGSISYAGIAETELWLSEDSYFLLGDDLEDSKDSRYDFIGPVKEADIRGKVIPQR